MYVFIRVWLVCLQSRSAAEAQAGSEGGALDVEAKQWREREEEEADLEFQKELEVYSVYNT